MGIVTHEVVWHNNHQAQKRKTRSSTLSVTAEPSKLLFRELRQRFEILLHFMTCLVLFWSARWCVHFFLLFFITRWLLCFSIISRKNWILWKIVNSAKSLSQIDGAFFSLRWSANWITRVRDASKNCEIIELAHGQTRLVALLVSRREIFTRKVRVSFLDCKCELIRWWWRSDIAGEKEEKKMQILANCDR